MSVITVKPKQTGTDDGTDSDSEAEDAKATADGDFDFSKISCNRIRKFYLGNRFYKSHGLACYDAAYAPDGRLIACCGHDNTVTVHETYGKLKRVRTLIGHHTPVLRVVWANGNEILSASHGELILWNSVDGEIIKFLGQVHDNIVSAIDWARWLHLHRAEEVFISASYDMTVKIWRYSRKGGKVKVEERQVISCHDKVLSVAMHPTLEQFVSGFSDGKIYLYSCAEKNSTDAPIRIFGNSYGIAHTDAVLCLTWEKSVPGLPESPSVDVLHANIFASASHDKTVKIWYSDQERAHRTLSGHTNVVLSVAFGPEAVASAKRYRVFTAGHDAFIGIWDGRSGQLLNMMKDTNHQSWITSINVHPIDGLHLMTTSIQERYSLVRWEPLPPLPTTEEIIKKAMRNPMKIMRRAIGPVSIVSAFVYRKFLRRILPINRVIAVYRAVRNSALGRVVRSAEYVVDSVQWHINYKSIEARLYLTPYYYWWRKCYFEGLEIIEKGEVKPRLRQQWRRRARRYKIKLMMTLYPYRALRLARAVHAIAIWLERISRPKRVAGINFILEKTRPALRALEEKSSPVLTAGHRFLRHHIIPRLASLAKAGPNKIVRVCRRSFQRHSRVSDIEDFSAAKQAPDLENLVVTDFEPEPVDKVLFIFLHFDSGSGDNCLDRDEVNSLLDLMKTIDEASPCQLDEGAFQEMVEDFNPPKDRALRGLSLEGTRTLFEYAEEIVEDRIFELLQNEQVMHEEATEEGKDELEFHIDELSTVALDGEDDITVTATSASQASASEIDALQRRLAQIKSSLQEAMQRHDVPNVRVLTLERNSLRNEIAGKTGKLTTVKPHTMIPPGAGANGKAPNSRSGGWLLEAP